MNFICEAISGLNVDLNWLLEVTAHLDKFEKKQKKYKQENLPSLSGDSSFEKMALSNSVSTSLILNSNQNFFALL